MDELVIRIIEQGGYLGIALLMFAENVFPPIPSEVIMGVGGVLVAKGSLNFWALALAGTIGSTLGNYFWFLLGDWLGYERTRPLVKGYGRWITLEWGEVRKISTVFRRHGQWIVLVFRCFPIVRTMISLPAGLAHMKHSTFLIFTFIGSGVWNLALIGGGKLLGNNLEETQHWLSLLIVAFVVAGFGGWLYRVITWNKKPH